MKGYKGFDKDLKCRGLQFAVGETFEAPAASLCKAGLHFCEHPLDTFKYYAPGDGSRYCLVKASGDVTDVETGANADTKRACTKITIVRELTLTELIVAAVKMSTAEEQSRKARGAATASGYSGAATASGYSGAATASGYRGAATASGDGGAATASGDRAIACALGIGARARGKAGTWIVIAERDDSNTDNRGAIKTVKTALVDGKKIKADTFYTLNDGKFTEVE